MGRRRPVRLAGISLAAMVLATVTVACGGEPETAVGPSPSPVKTGAEAASPARSRTPQATVSLPPEAKFEAAEGRFAVYRMYRQVRRFVEEARAQPQRDRWELYRPLVVEPMDEFVRYLEPDWERRWAAWVRTVDIEGLEHTVSLMAEAEVDGIAGRALEEIAAALGPYAWPQRPVFLLAGQWPYDPGNFYGHANIAGAVTIFLYAAPGEDPREFWRTNLPALVAHEAHHSVREALGKVALTLIGQIVFEGLADAFAEELYGSPATHVQLDKETERRLWAQIQESAFSTDQNLIDRYLQGSQGVPPRTAHYFGYKIVQAYKASHTGTTAASLVGASEFDIYAESGYEP